MRWMGSGFLEVVDMDPRYAPYVSTPETGGIVECQEPTTLCACTLHWQEAAGVRYYGPVTRAYLRHGMTSMIT